MRKFILILFLACGPLITNAQDSLWFRNKQIEVGKVTEISEQHIKYTRADMIDGPVFIKYTWEIEKIRFENGQVQLFSQQRPKPTINPAPRTSQRIERVDNRLFYNGRAINEKKLLSLVQNHPDPAKRKMLQMEFDKLIVFKKKQHTWGTFGPILAAAVALPTLIYFEMTDNGMPFVAGATIGSVIFIGSLSKAVSFKKARTNQFFRIGELYNQ